MRAYELLAERGDWPLHLGVTEAGPAFQGTIKSATAFGALLSQGIGDTIRVSLSAPPVEEVKVGIQILQSLNLRPRKLEIVSCPSCGRAQVDVYKLAEQVTAGLEGMEVPLRVAVMGCVVNGPGEAREADLGVASGNGKGQIFVKGEVIKTVPESQIVETLIEEAMRIAEGMEAVEGAAAQVTCHLSATPDRSALGSCRAHDPPRCPPPRGRRPRRVPGARAPGPGGQRLRRPPGARPPTWSRAGSAARCGAGSTAGSSSPPATSAPTWSRSRRRADDARAFAERALARGRSVSTIVGPAGGGPGVLERRRRQLGPAARGRAGSSRTSRSPAGPRSSPTRWSAVPTRTTCDVLYPACVAMYTEEVGFSPEFGGGAGSTGPGHQLISRGWSFARFDGDGWCSRPRSPARRRTPRRSRASGCRRTAAARASPRRAWRRWSQRCAARSRPVVSLYVNDWNTPAARASTSRSASARPHGSRR